jgi:NADPH-dependent 2,4-dienoyl-CoA reductase/sulfur reductase-like enzyme
MADAVSEVGAVVVGAGLAGITVARQLRAEGYTDPITVVGDEQEPPYDRPPLSKALLTGSGPGRVGLMDADEAAAAGIELRRGATAVALDPDARQVHLGDAGALTYASCVVATGSRVRRLPDLGEPGGLHYLRSMKDALALRAALERATRLVVVGAGFIGLEVASSAVSLGLSVTVVEREAMPLTRVLGEQAGHLARDLQVSNGVDLRCGAGVARIVTSPGADGAELVQAVELSDGTTVPADVVVLGAGAVPNVEWLAGSGVVVDDGVVCDGHGRGSVDGVWAAGDVARWPNAVTGLHVRVEQWQAALDQASIVAHNIAHPQSPRSWDSVPYFWSDQFGRKIQFCGHPGAASRILASPAGPVVAFGSEGLLTGVLTIGQPRVLARARRLVAERRSWSDLADLVGASYDRHSA